MKLVIQRIREASVRIDGEIHAEVGLGILVLIAVDKGDTIEEAGKLANKLLKFRIFEDERGKMSRTVEEVKGDLLVVPEFTLAGDPWKGTRPSFDTAEAPEKAKSLIEEFVRFLKESGLTVREGVFGAKMDISLVNDGPVTFVLESKP